jgi:hypothetical protein
MAPQPISVSYFINPSHQSVCQHVYSPTVVRWWLCKNVIAATNTRTTTEELLDASFSMWTMPIKGGRRLVLPSTSCLIFEFYCIGHLQKNYKAVTVSTGLITATGWLTRQLQGAEICFRSWYSTMWSSQEVWGGCSCTTCWIEAGFMQGFHGKFLRKEITRKTWKKMGVQYWNTMVM